MKRFTNILIISLLFTSLPTQAEWVNGYYRSNGTYVNGYYRRDRNSSNYSYTPTMPVNNAPLMGQVPNYGNTITQGFNNGRKLKQAWQFYN